MRRKLMVVVGLAALVGGCSMFSAHSDVIEEAAGQQFTAARLADLLTRIRAPMDYNTQTGTFVTALWTDLTLFSQSVANDKITTDSSFIADAMWPIIQSTKYNRWLDTVLSRKAQISDATLDSAYKADKARAVQHILIKADSAGPKEAKEIARKKAEGILAQLKGGASFNKLAFENTDDPGSKADSGYYGPKPKGVWMPSFDKELWSLKPGEMSGIVTTPYGYHIIRRPTELESARFWRDSLSRAVAEPIITAYLAQLDKDYDTKIDANAMPHIRAALADRYAHLGDKTSLESYKGGSFTTGDFVRWIDVELSDPSRLAQMEDKLRQAPDSDLTKALKTMTQQTLLLNEADKNGIRIRPEEWQAMRSDFIAGVDSLKATIGLTGPAFDPKTTSASSRSKAAAGKVDDYFNDLVVQKKQLQVLPGILAATLREHNKTKFNAIAMQHGLDLAKAKHAADSAKAAGPGTDTPGAAPLPQGAIKPAPGGPPTGGATPPPAPGKP